MKIILSHAKKMITDTDSIEPIGLPEFIDKTTEILSWLRDKSKEELKAVWKCNDKILEQSFYRLENMNLYQMLTPAVLSYEGITFQYMAPSVFEDRHFAYVQNHLRILSAFYGVLKPMDGVTSYRLEMQSRVGIGDAKNLYEYWGNLLYRSVIDDSRVIINLAYRMLKALGLEDWKAKELANSRKGYWRMAKVLNQIFSKKIIAKLGYTSMLDYYLIICEN